MIDREPLLESLTAFARSMTEPYDVNDVLDRLGAALTDVLGITGVGISVADPDDVLRYATSSSEIVTEIEVVQERAQIGPCYEAFRTVRPVLVSDIAERPEWTDFAAAAARLGLRSVAGVPMTVGRQVLGAVNLYHEGTHEWTSGDIDTAGVFSDMAAGYLLHAALEESRRLTDQLEYALQSRIVIEQAKGLLAGELDITVDEAFSRLRRYVRSVGRPLRATAEAVVHEGFRPPGLGGATTGTPEVAR